MPYRDKERRRQYEREYKRRLRAGLRASTPSTPDGLPPEARTASVEQVLALLDEAAGLIRSDGESKATEKGKALTSVAVALLRAVETANLVSRIEAIEQALAQAGRLRVVR